MTGLDRGNNASENKKENCAITRLLNSRLCGNDMVKALMPMVNDDPRRVVSLIANATEIVCALGAQDRLVGRSHKCDSPKM